MPQLILHNKKSSWAGTFIRHTWGNIVPWQSGQLQLPAKQYNPVFESQRHVHMSQHVAAHRDTVRSWLTISLARENYHQETDNSPEVDVRAD